MNVLFVFFNETFLLILLNWLFLRRFSNGNDMFALPRVTRVHICPRSMSKWHFWFLLQASITSNTPVLCSTSVQKSEGSDCVEKSSSRWIHEWCSRWFSNCYLGQQEWLRMSLVQERKEGGIHRSCSWHLVNSRLSCNWLKATVVVIWR